MLSCYHAAQGSSGEEKILALSEMSGFSVPTGVWPGSVQTGAAASLQGHFGMKISSYLTQRVTGIYFSDVKTEVERAHGWGGGAGVGEPGSEAAALRFNHRQPLH